MTNQEWILFLAKEWNVSNTSARDMLHSLFLHKKFDNIKKIGNQRETKEGEEDETDRR